MQTTVVFKAPHVYASHPSIAALESGDWLVAFGASTQRSPYLHPPEDPDFRTYVTRSSDQGSTWETPRVAPSFDWYGVETPGISQISTGEVLLSQWRFRWHPLEEARRRWEAGDRNIFVSDAGGHNFQRAVSAESWAQHPYPYARADDGAYVHFSTDEGRTWSRTVPVDVSPYQSAFSPKGVIELSNGDLLLALATHTHVPRNACIVLHSSDKGHFWHKPIEAATLEGHFFAEPSVAETAGGKLLMLLREATTGHIHQCDSYDGGETWLPPRALPLWGYPSHCIRLHDSRMLVIYGRRRSPCGIRAALSDDEGESWSDEIVIRDDLASTYEGHNLGYPSVIEYAPGKLFSVYYGEDAGVTCIQGTYFDV